MMKWICILFFVTFFFVTDLWASDTVIVHKDARMELLTSKQAQINKHASLLTSSGQYKGYRVQVVSTSNRDQAFKIKGELLTRFPDQKTYALFQSPNFKVRIGNYIKRDEAEKLRIELQKLLPNNIYIVEDAVEYVLKDEIMNEIDPQ